jgi:hypothetical protein
VKIWVTGFFFKEVLLLHIFEKGEGYIVTQEGI